MASPASQQAATGAAALGFDAAATEAELRARLAAAPASAAAKATATAALTAALVGFLSQLRRRQRGWLAEQLAQRVNTEKVGHRELVTLLAHEDALGRLFAKESMRRMSAGLPAALAKATQAEREAAVQGLLEKERRYARMRQEAMAERAFAGIERIEVRHDSPTGAFWWLDPTVKEHTAGCLKLGGRFWPWEVLDRVHPPRHHGCHSRLLGLGAAIDAGLMRAGDVPDTRAAVKAAAGVVMEAEEWRQAPLAEGFDEAKHPRGAHGRWARAIEMVKAANVGTPYGTGDAKVHAASTTTEHPRFFYHVSSSEHRASIAESGLEAHRTLGGRGRTENPRVYLSAEPTDITPRFDTRPRDQYRVDTQGIALRPDPELPGQWAISAGDIPADRLELIGTTHPDGMPKAPR